TTADLHTRDAVLPALDEAAQRELDGLASAPRGVELLTRVELDPGIVDGDRVTGVRLLAVSDDDVADLQLAGGGGCGCVELGLCALCHGSIQPERPGPVNAVAHRNG